MSEQDVFLADIERTIVRQYPADRIALLLQDWSTAMREHAHEALVAHAPDEADLHITGAAVCARWAARFAHALLEHEEASWRKPEKHSKVI